MHAPVRPVVIPPDLLMLAYRDGIFPMADSREDPEVFWVEPRRRAVLPLDGFHCSRSLARSLRQGRFAVTCDAAFDEVLSACAAPRGTQGGETWINAPLAEAYRALHRTGHAHSIEVWLGDEDAGGEDAKGRPRLAGGLYGVGFDRVFCGESMFSRATDASKVALAWLVASLGIGGGELLDCQFMTEHLRSLGAVEITQARYRQRLIQAQRAPHNRPARRQVPEAAAAAPVSPATGAAGGGAVDEAAPLALPEAFAALLTLAKSAGFSSCPGKFIAQSLTQTS